jgi:transposase-like protein
VLYANGGVIETQEKLYREVMEQIGWQKESFRVSPAKMREILLSSKKIQVEIRYATKPLARPLKGCPVCRRPVREIHNQTLDSGRVVAGYKCTACTFWTPIRRRVPARYIFRVGS